VEFLILTVEKMMADLKHIAIAVIQWNPSFKTALWGGLKREVVSHQGFSFV
jgi:hypothetical protein